MKDMGVKTDKKGKPKFKSGEQAKKFKKRLEKEAKRAKKKLKLKKKKKKQKKQDSWKKKMKLKMEAKYKKQLQKKLSEQARTAPGRVLKVGTPEHKAALQQMGLDVDLMVN